MEFHHGIVHNHRDPSALAQAAKSVQVVHATAWLSAPNTGAHIPGSQLLGRSEKSRRVRTKNQGIDSAKG